MRKVKSDLYFSNIVLLFLSFLLFSGAFAQTSLTTYHNDQARDGWNQNETILTTANVNSTSFGKLFSNAVDGQVYAQPLYMPNVSIGGGTHNVVYIVTENDSAYAFDADSAGVTYWHTSFLTGGAMPVSQADVGNCTQIIPEIGITDTPVIDSSSGIMYFVAMTKTVSAGVTTFTQTLHALNITTGVETASGPQTIGATFPGKGDGGTTVTFRPQAYKERCALALVNGVVYTSWTGHCDSDTIAGNYYGWVIGYSASNITQQLSVFCSAPNGSESSFWESGDGPSVDSAGNLYYLSANGTFDTTAPVTDYGQCFLKLNTVGNAVTALDYFAPMTEAAMSSGDQDVGSAGQCLLPASWGTTAHPNIIIGADKPADLYVVDADTGKMGEFSSTANNIIQTVYAIGGKGYTTPAIYSNGTTDWVYWGMSGEALKAFTFANGQYVTTPSSSTTAIYGAAGSYSTGCVPSVSSNGTTNGIVWTLAPGTPVTLFAYDATNLANVLYNSAQNAARDSAEVANVKFAPPSVVNGKVYVPTTSSLVVYGLLTTPTPTSTGSPIATATPTSTASRTPTATATSTATPTRTVTSTVTSTPISTLTSTASRTPTVTASMTASSTTTPSITATRTYTLTSTSTPTLTSTNTIMATSTNTATQTATKTDSATPSSTPSSTPTWTSTFTATSSITLTPTYTASRTATATASTTTTSTSTSTSTNAVIATPTVTSTASRTPTATATMTVSATPTNTVANTPSETSTFTTSVNTATPSSTATKTSTNTQTATMTPTNTVANTPSETSTFTTSVNTATSSPTATETGTNTPALTATPTDTTANTATPSSTATNTAVNTPSATPSSTETATITPTYTSEILTNTPTLTPVNTATYTATSTASNTMTQTVTVTPTNTVANTPSETSTFTTSANTATSSPTATKTGTNTPTLTATVTVTRTFTPVFTDTSISTATGTSTATLTPTNSPTIAPTLSPTFTSTLQPTLTPTPSSTIIPTSSPTIPPTTTGTPGISSTPIFYPNPAPIGAPVTLLLNLASPSNVRIQIFTVAFREVQDETIANVPAGTAKLPVPLVDREGKPLANGLYYAVITANGKRWVLKLLILG